MTHFHLIYIKNDRENKIPSPGRKKKNLKLSKQLNDIIHRHTLEVRSVNAYSQA